MTRRRQLLWALVVAAGVVVADQAAKSAVIDRIERGTTVDVLGPLEFTHVHNDGVAFGLAGGGGVFVIVLSLVALVALGVFVAAAPGRSATWLAGGLILGGASGNLIDRIRLGYVTDFISLPHWPAFNLADCAITVGVVALAFTLLRDGREES
ncbi:MAG: signal peptidase II [Solirubrobacterales bacterium]